MVSDAKNFFLSLLTILCVKSLFESLPIKKMLTVPFLLACRLFICSGDNSFANYESCEHFLPVGGLPVGLID